MEEGASEDLSGRGRRTLTSVPSPGRLSSEIFPPCCSTIHCAMGRPRPVPPGSRLRPGSARSNGDLPPGRRILERIVKEDQQQLCEAVFITVDRDGFKRIENECLTSSK